MSLTPGDVASITYSLTVDGTATDATVTLTVTAPDGTTSSPTPSHTGLGAYQADVLVNQAGTWTYRWVAAGAATDAEEGTFTVGGPVSIAAVKVALDKTLNVDDDELQRILDAATAEYVEWVGPLPGSYTGTFPITTGDIVLPSPLAVAVTAVGYNDGTTADPATLEVSNGIARWGYGASPRYPYAGGRMTLTYTVGALPANHRETIIADVAGYFERTQRGGSAAAFPGEGGYSEAYATTPTVLFPRIRELARSTPRVA